MIFHTTYWGPRHNPVVRVVSSAIFTILLLARPGRKVSASGPDLWVVFLEAGNRPPHRAQSPGPRGPPTTPGGAPAGARWCRWTSHTHATTIRQDSKARVAR